MNEKALNQAVLAKFVCASYLMNLKSCPSHHVILYGTRSVFTLELFRPRLLYAPPVAQINKAALASQMTNGLYLGMEIQKVKERTSGV